MTRLAVLAALLFVSAACTSDKGEKDAGPVDAGPKERAEAEPNDRPENALELSESTIVTAALGAVPAKPDEDWYALSSATPKEVDLTVSGIPAADVMLEILDIDRNRLALVNSEAEGKPERMPNLTVKGKLFAKVSGAKKGAGGAYTLTAVFKEPRAGVEVEPNDRAVDAHALALGESVSGFLGHSSDEDWYRLELSPPTGAPPALPVSDGGELADAGAPASDSEQARVALRLELSGVEGVTFDLSILSAAEAPLFQIKGKDNEPLSLRNIGVRASDQIIYVVVKSAWTGTGKGARRTFNADKEYALSISKEEAGTNAELEPNDELAKATPLPLNGYREGFLSPKSDLDYYVLRADAPTLAKVQVSGVERLDLVLSLVEPTDGGTSEKVLLKVNDGAVKEPELLNNLLCSNECYLKVEGAQRKLDNGKLQRDFENAEVPYRLTVSSVADDGSQEHEPNNTAETAQPISIGKPVRGTIHPKKDIDLFKLDLSSRPVKTALKASVTGILKVDLGLYLYSVDDEGTSTLLQTADRAKGDAPEIIRQTVEPGVYLLELRDSKNREANFQDAYQLTVELDE